MTFKKVSIFIFSLICLTIFVPDVAGRQSQAPGRDLKIFKDLLATVNASFTLPDGFNEVKPVANEKFPYQYALQVPGAEFEIRFAVNSLKPDWKSFEQARGEKINPDSLYLKNAALQVKNLAGDGRVFNRTIPPSYLQQYNADLGRSYYLSLADAAETNHYQFALYVVLQKNHYGTITVVCMGNQRGPEFFKNINKLKDCIKFNN